MPLQLHRRIPLIRRPFFQRDTIAAERDILQAQLAAARQELVNTRCIQSEASSTASTDLEALSSDEATVVGEHWDNQLKTYAQTVPNSVWWLSPIVIRHINRIVCGEPIDGIHAGFHRAIGTALQDSPHPRRALSIGCGVGTKEMDLLDTGAIDSFDCYDVSGAVVIEGRRVAEIRGLSERITFQQADPFTLNIRNDFRLVYWNNSLHHMSDTRAAIEWSKNHLCKGGIFAMDDYVGKTRQQHSPTLVAWGTRLLTSLPEYLRSHCYGFTAPPMVGLVSAEEIANEDPSECVDSGSIVPALLVTFPDAKLINTGGAAYLVAMAGLLQNFRSDTELALLNAILMADEAVSKEVGSQVESQYAVAIAQKN